jgi:outer membrane protein OmpA-like peptidoglycan-associated protein
MSYSLKLVKSFENFLNEATDPLPKKLTFAATGWTLPGLQKINKEAFDYVNDVIKSLNEDEAFKDMKKIKMQLIKAKPLTGLSLEEANALNVKFKNSEDFLFGSKPEDFNTVYIDKKEFKEILEDKEGAELKKMYDELITKVADWNKTNSKIFKFENNKGDAVNNPDESKASLESLKTIFDSYSKILKSTSVELVGHTSSTGDDAKNQKLSEDRAEAIKKLLFEIIPAAQNLLVTSSGKGETELLQKDDATDKEKQKENRRVEVKISLEAPVSTAPAEKITYNCIVYGFWLNEIEESGGGSSTKQSKQKSYKPKYKINNPKKGIPCPNWGR